MRAHFFDLNRFYLGTMEMSKFQGDYYRVPILENMEVPLRLEEGPPVIRFMQYRNFKALPVYEGGKMTVLLFMEVS